MFPKPPKEDFWNLLWMKGLGFSNVFLVPLLVELLGKWKSSDHIVRQGLLEMPSSPPGAIFSVKPILLTK